MEFAILVFSLGCYVLARVGFFGKRRVSLKSGKVVLINKWCYTKIILLPSQSREVYYDWSVFSSHRQLKHGAYRT